MPHHAWALLLSAGTSLADCCSSAACAWFALLPPYSPGAAGCHEPPVQQPHLPINSYGCRHVASPAFEALPDQTLGIHRGCPLQSSQRLPQHVLNAFTQCLTAEHKETAVHCGGCLSLSPCPSCQASPEGLRCPQAGCCAGNRARLPVCDVASVQNSTPCCVCPGPST